jgi:hypothetical protein
MKSCIHIFLATTLKYLTILNNLEQKQSYVIDVKKQISCIYFEFE